MAETLYRGYHDAFKMLDTFGFPLVMCMDECEKKGFRVALDTFVFDAIKAGWSFEKAIAVVTEAVTEKYGMAFVNSERFARFKPAIMNEIADGALNR